jgi:PAS domain S-box-containing protein
LTSTGPELVVAGAVGGMALVALLWFFAHRRDPVPLWMGLFCLSLCAHFLLPRGHVLAAPAAYLAGPFLVLYAAALYPGVWQRRAALGAVALGVAAAIAALLLPASSQELVLACMRVVAFAVAALGGAAAVHVMRERRSVVPLAIAGIALGYPLLLTGNSPAGVQLVSFVLLPGVALARRFARAFDAETLRSLNQAKFTNDLFESVPVALALRDPEGKYLVVNRTWETYFGVKRDEVLGTTPRARMSEKVTDTLLALDRAAMDKGVDAPIELHDVDLRGKRYLQSRTAMADSQGKVLGVLIASIDITERSAYEEALRESVRLRDEVERMSRHDLKTPLNSIIAVPRLLREGRKLSSEEHQLLSIVERAGYRILNMVNLSLDLFRMESGTYTFRPEAVDLDDMVHKVIGDLESQADSKSLAVRTVRLADPSAPPDRPRSGPIFARGEDLLCYSMLANLLKNAIEASPEGGVVTVTLEPGNGILLHIHNRGAVPEPVRATFFDKYSTAGKAGGLGLGTYSALLMARVQEGNITMRTSAEEGTTLTVRLAEAQADTAPAIPGAPSAGDRAPARRPQLPPLDVLIVDDDEFNRLVMRRYLPSPLNAVMAVNGRAALEALRRQAFDFVFLDLEMPVMDGYEAAERIRGLERETGRKPTTLVAFSSNEDEASIRRALAAGCDHYLTKPAPRETLWKLLAGGPVASEKKSEKEPAPSDPVEVDVDLRPTLAAFFVSRRKALDQIDAALAGGDRAGARRLAHKLAGSFSLYGFKWACAQCRLIERTAAEDDPLELADKVASVRGHLDSAELRFVESAAPAAQTPA